MDWRVKTRELFETHFARGYQAIDFVRARGVGGRREPVTIGMC